MFRRNAMFTQSLIQVFKALAEFQGYVPPAAAAQAEPDQATTACQTKQAVVSVPKQAVTVSCC